jgi:hypothetical protein
VKIGHILKIQTFLNQNKIIKYTKEPCYIDDKPDDKYKIINQEIKT